MKIGFWAIIFLVAIALLVHFCIPQPAQPDHTRENDSLKVVNREILARLNDRDSADISVRQKFESLTGVLNAKIDSVSVLNRNLRNNPRVVEVTRTVPEISAAFRASDAEIFALREKVSTQADFITRHLESDSLRRIDVDSLVDNFKQQILLIGDENKSLRAQIKRSSRPLSLGISAGPAVIVTPGGQVYGGMGLSLGLTYRFPRRQR